jgi:hypothetical protein
VLADTEADPIDTNADTNLHEQRRTPAIRKQGKYAYLQEFLNTGEQLRSHGPAIPLNGVSRVRILPPTLFFSLFCRKNARAKKKAGTSPGLLYTTQYTNAA